MFKNLDNEFTAALIEVDNMLGTTLKEDYILAVAALNTKECRIIDYLGSLLQIGKDLDKQKNDCAKNAEKASLVKIIDNAKEKLSSIIDVDTIQSLNNSLTKALSEVDNNTKYTELNDDYKLATAGYKTGEINRDEYFELLAQIGRELSKLRTEVIHEPKDSLVVRIIENAKAKLREVSNSLIS